MARVTFRIPWSYRIWIFLFLLISWLTGIAFFVLNKWIFVEGEFGPEKHPWQYPVLRIHGAAAFLMMITYGYLLASHVPAGWKQKRQRRSGLILVCAQGFLILSAYGLYYLADEGFRVLVSYAHALVGVTFPLLLAVHIISGRHSRP